MSKDMEVLTVYDNAEIMEFAAIVDLDEIIAKIKQIDALKVALDSADQFHENAIRYARLEAAALIRVAELDGVNRLRGYHRKVAEWLYAMPEEERERYIAMCGEGLTIDQVWKREVHDGKKLQEQLNYVQYLRDDIIQTAKTEGIVDMSLYSSCVKEHLSGQLAEDVIDGTRNALRKMGAVGIGDGRGTYVIPNPETKDKIKAAVLLRYQSLCDDLKNIKELCKSAEMQLSYKDFENNIYKADRSGHGYLIHILFALNSMGVISDADEMFTKVGESEINNEIKYTNKLINCGKLQAAKMIYERQMTETNKAV